MDFKIEYLDRYITEAKKKKKLKPYVRPQEHLTNLVLDLASREGTGADKTAEHVKRLGFNDILPDVQNNETNYKKWYDKNITRSEPARKQKVIDNLKYEINEAQKEGYNFAYKIEVGEHIYYDKTMQKINNFVRIEFPGKKLEWAIPIDKFYNDLANEE